MNFKGFLANAHMIPVCYKLVRICKFNQFFFNLQNTLKFLLIICLYQKKFFSLNLRTSANMRYIVNILIFAFS